MTTIRTIKREEPGQWLLTREGEKISIARSEHSDWLDVPVDAIPQLLADLKEFAAADQPMVHIRVLL